MSSSTETVHQSGSGAAQRTYDVVIVGAGFSGMYLLHRLRALGLSARVFEAGTDVGGTWYWNRYPGARVDVESLTYSYSFDPELEQEWQWTERYSPQPEILRYAGHVADRFQLRSDIQFETKVTRADFDEESGRWTVETDRGDTFDAQHFVMAVGCLSVPKLPDFKGMDRFKGEKYHTGLWPHEPVSFAGKRVIVVGTGSSAIQTIPVVAEEAEHVTVLQRTPNFSVPAWNRPLDKEWEAEYKGRYRELREKAKHSFVGDIFPISETPARDFSPEEQRAELEKRWQQGGFSVLVAFSDILLDEESNRIATEFVHEKIRSIVKDPATAELLCPKDHPFGTKRMCVDTNYYATYNRDNVSLVNIKGNPIAEVTEKGILLEDGTELEGDAIIFAIGFDAMTGPILNVDIHGRDGASLREEWAGGPLTYLGLTVAGFPNMFLITGPGSPSVLSNMMVSIEQHVDLVADTIGALRERGSSTIEATPEAQDAWMEHVNDLGSQTLHQKANSWYVGANIPGKPRVFMPYVGGVEAYRKKCDEIVANGYEGFRLS
jgi:cyclohexanone monooxygenase